MAEEKRITISRSLNGDTIYYIARNSSGAVFARALTLKELEAAIKTYKEPPPVEEEKDEGKGVSVKGKEAAAEEVTEEDEQSSPAEKKFLDNDLKTKVEERKQQSKKKSFWDKLK